MSNNRAIYVSDFISALLKRDENNLTISLLESTIMKYVQEALELAYKRLDCCGEKALYSLAQYDRTGIFQYFHVLSQLIFNCSFKKVTKTISTDELVFEYDGDKLVFLPVKMFDGDDLTDLDVLTYKIIEICKYTIDSFKKELECVKFK